MTDIGDLDAPWWNTPTNINQRGDIVGFAGDPAFPDGDILHAFIWTAKGGIRPLGALPGHVHSEAYGINEKRQVVGVSCDANFVELPRLHLGKRCHGRPERSQTSELHGTARTSQRH